MFNITNIDEVRAGGLPKLVSADTDPGTGCVVGHWQLEWSAVNEAQISSFEVLAASSCSMPGGTDAYTHNARRPSAGCEQLSEG